MAALFDTDDSPETRAVMARLALRSSELEPHQRAAVWTLRVWLAVLDPALRAGAFVAAIAAMVALMFLRVPVWLAVGVYASGAFFGFLGVRYGMERARRALCARVLKSLELAPQAVGGLTPAMLPAIRPAVAVDDNAKGADNDDDDGIVGL